MPEIKDSPPQIKQESFKPKIERILNITNKCLSGDITPIEAFRQIVDRSPQQTETLEPQKPILSQNDTESEQQKTNEEIEQIRQEISIITEEPKTETTSDSRESLVIKDEYYLQKEKTIFDKGFIDSHEISYQKNLDSKKTISDKISSKISISKLKRLGVENPQEFYKVFDERGFSVKDMIKRKTINTYLEMPPEEISKGIDRVEKLGFEIELYKPQTKDCLKEISAISDDDFNNFASELNEYSFLNRALKETGENRLVCRIKDGNYNDKYLTNPLFDKFIESAQNGQINPEIKKRLDILKEIQLLEDPKYKEKSPHLKDYPHFYEFTRKGSSSHLGGCQADILDIFNPNIKIDFKFPESKYLDQKIFERNFDFIWENLFTISNSVDCIKNLSEEQIDKLHNNPNGVANFLKKVYTKTQGNSSCEYIIEYTVSNKDKINSSFNNETERSNFFLDLVKKNSSDYHPDEYKRHYFISALQEIGIYDISSFPNKKDQNYWNIVFMNIYNRELSISLIDQKDKFFNDDNSIKPYFFETFTKDYFHSLSSKFFLEYLDNETISKFPLKDKIIWSIVNNLKENRHEQSHFLAKISELSEIINKTEFINPEFFDSVITECGEKCLRFGIFTDEVINNLPPKDKIIWNLYKNLNEFHDYHFFNDKDKVIKVFMEIKENFSQYLDENNNLNSLFFEKIIREFTNNNSYYGVKDIVNKYLTEQNINKLNDQEKIFWTIYKDFPFGESEEKNVDLPRQRYDIRNFLINNRANFSSEYLNKKNQLKSSFMMAILKQNNNNEFNELKPLLTENILKNLIPSEKSFWKSYFDADIYNNKYRDYRVDNIIREILIKRKEDYKKFFDTNGHPTSFLFELAVGLDSNKNGKDNYSGIISLNLTDVPNESFINFSPQDKAFWIAYRDTFWINNESKFTSEYDGYSLRRLLLDNHSDFSKFLDENNKLNNLFLETLIQNQINIPNIFLSEENLSNFSDQDRKMLEIIRANNNIYFNRFIIDHKDQINDLFDNQNKPKFLFYKTITSEKINLDRWKHLLTPEQIINFPQESQKFWTTFKEMVNKDCPDYILRSMIDNEEKFDLYFNQEGLPTHIFLASLVNQNLGIPNNFLTDENLKNFSDKDKRIWQIVRQKNLLEINQLIINNKDQIDNFFDSKNYPNFSFLKLVSKENINLNQFITTDFIENRPISELKFWNKFKQISSDSQEKIFKKFIEDSMSIEEIYKYTTLFEMIENSTSKEIQKIKTQLLGEIIKTINPEETFNKISDIFIKNNLPTVGKIYKIFNLLYTPKRINECFRPQNILSPVLSNSNNIHRRDIIFRDLVDINLKSGNRSLKNYLQFFANSNSVLDKCFKDNSITPEEDHQLSYFFTKLETLYDNSILGRREKVPKTSKSELKEKVNDLYQKYHVKEGQSISDRVAEIYLSSIGITNINQALEIISNSKINTDQKNRNNYINLNENGIVSSDGALIKGIEDSVLESILNSGSVAREYLGSDSGSDSTPFDTDTIKIDSALNYQNLRTTLSSSPSFGYGSLALIIKNKGQFQETSKEKNTAKYQPNKLEIFSSGVLGNQHFGVRTGFPSSEIDYLVIQNESSVDDNKLNDIYYQIAKHGTYIPVLNLDGQVIYTPELYDEYRKAFDGVAQFDGKEIKVSKIETKSPFYSQIQEIKKESVDKNKEVIEKDRQIREKIREVLQELNITLKDKYDTSTIGASFQNIGSSGRNTNLPNDFDFDYTLILDGPNYKMANEVKNLIVNKINHSDTIPTDQSEQIRLSGVSGLGSELIDLDIGINTTADTLIFGSHQAIQEKLESIRNNSGEDVYNEVVANIVLTKKILKENHAYKKGDAQDGGIGGIGVENWILANGGSIENAFKSFWQKSHNENGELISLSEFQKKYSIRDAGENLRESKRSHDNFIYALQEKGYQAMIKTISSYIK